MKTQNVTNNMAGLDSNAWLECAKCGKLTSNDEERAAHKCGEEDDA